MPRRRIARLHLAGELVRLRPHAVEDGAAAFALLSGQQAILRWLVWDGPSSARELSEYYGHWNFEGESGRDLRLAIEERASGALAGSLTLRFRGQPGQGDIGYWMGIPFQGRGLGGEALLLSAHLAFGHLAAQSLSAWVFVGNAASRAILERAGFTLVRTVPGRIRKAGRMVDEWHFVLLHSEWRRSHADFRPVEESFDWAEEDGENGLDSPARPFASG